MDMKSVKTRKHLSQAMLFIILFGIVSLFSDMTHEGASSIRGAYLTLLGASAGAIGFASGLGELVGYSMRYVFGRLTDKTKQYWPKAMERHCREKDIKECLVVATGVNSKRVRAKLDVSWIHMRATWQNADFSA